MKQASEGHCGTNTSVLRSLTKIFLITQVLAVSPAEFFMAVFPLISWTFDWEFVHINSPFLLLKVHKLVLAQTQMVHQDVRKKTMQAYIKYKSYYDLKANASDLKEADYVYILQPKADHQESKIPSAEFRWIGPYLIEK